MEKSNHHHVIEQLKDKLISTSTSQIRQIVQEARDEALAEVKAMLKERMLEAIVERALGKVEVLADPDLILDEEPAAFLATQQDEAV